MIKQVASASAFIVGVGSETLDAFTTYQDRRKQRPHESPLQSKIMAGGTWAVRSAMWSLMPSIMWGKFAADIGISLGPSMAAVYKQGPSHKAYNPNVGGGYFDTELNATMRQRAVSAIQNSRMNARSVIGNEARSLHGGRRWF